MDQYPINPMGVTPTQTTDQAPSNREEVVDNNGSTQAAPPPNGFNFQKFKRLAAPWLAVFILLAGLGAAFIVSRQSTEIRQQASGQNPIDLSIQPPSVTLESGQTTTVDIVANTNDSQLSAVDLRITSSNAAVIDFDSANLTPVLPQQLPEGAGIVITNGTSDHVDITGGVKCTNSSNVGCGAQSGTGLIIAKLTLQGTGAGTTDLTFANNSQVAAIGQDGDAKGNTSGSSVTVGGGPTETHMECQNNACVEVTGSGINECVNNSDCQQQEETQITVCSLGSTATGCDYFGGDGLQTAIDDAGDNTKISLLEGIYTKSDEISWIINNKTGLELIGSANGRTVLTGSRDGENLITLRENSTATIKSLVIFNSGRDGIDLLNSSQAVLFNNTFVGNGYGVNVTSEASTVQLKNNIAAFNDGGFIGIELTNITLAEYNLGFSNGDTGTWNQGFANWPPASNIEADPQFTNMAASDFTPLPGSPACDGGGNGTYIGAVPCEGGVGTISPEQGDIVDDDKVDGLDLILILDNWHLSPPIDSRADINEDNSVDGLDLIVILNNWHLGLN